MSGARRGGAYVGTSTPRSIDRTSAATASAAFMQRLGYGIEHWSGGVNFVQGAQDPYLCFLPAPAEHLAAGYHRKRVGLNHLAFHGRSRAHVDELTDWVRQAGHRLLYEDRHPYAGGLGYCALYCRDPDRIKVEVVAPAEP